MILIGAATLFKPRCRHEIQTFSPMPEGTCVTTKQRGFAENDMSSTMINIATQVHKSSATYRLHSCQQIRELKFLGSLLFKTGTWDIQAKLVGILYPLYSEFPYQYLFMFFLFQQVG